MQVSVDGPSRTTVNAAGMKQGAACFQYVAMHAGVYTISATIDGRHINNSPATVTASIAKPCAPNCEVLPPSSVCPSSSCRYNAYARHVLFYL